MASARTTRGVTGNAKPKQTWVAIAQLGLKAQELATTHSAALGTRITADFLTSFASDLTALNAVVPGALNSKKGAIQLTAAQNDALLVGHNLVMGVRMAVRGQTKDKNVLLAYGVGTDVPLLVKNVKAALQTIASRAASHATEAATFGIIGDDVTTINAALTAIDAADTAQEAARATAPTTTKTRNATAQRILAGVKRIAGAGMRVFASDATTRALFAALK